MCDIICIDCTCRRIIQIFSLSLSHTHTPTHTQIDLDSKLGKSTVISKATPQSQSGGYVPYTL